MALTLWQNFVIQRSIPGDLKPVIGVIEGTGVSRVSLKQKTTPGVFSD